jgi:hypothetical protein
MSSFIWQQCCVVCIPRELKWEERLLYLRLLYLSAALSLAQIPKPDQLGLYIRGRERSQVSQE